MAKHAQEGYNAAADEPQEESSSVFNGVACVFLSVAAAISVAVLVGLVSAASAPSGSMSAAGPSFAVSEQVVEVPASTGAAGANDAADADEPGADADGADSADEE